jgi:hypothetical protein
VHILKSVKKVILHICPAIFQSESYSDEVWIKSDNRGLRWDIKWDDKQFWKANRRDTGTRATPNGSHISKAFNSRRDGRPTEAMSNGAPK